MKKVFLFIAALTLSAGLWAEKVVVKDTLAYDRFDREALGENYTITSNVTLDNNTKINTIKLACPKNGTSGKNFASASNNVKVALDTLKADSIVWTVCMRQNYNATSLSGFASGKRGIAAILAGTSDLALDAGQGYAVIQGGNSTANYRLVRFDGGFGADNKFTDIIAGPVLTTIRDYCTFRVVYVPSTKTWTMYQIAREYNSADEFYDPDLVTDWTIAGSAQDNTFTKEDIVLSKYGFMQNYAGSQAFNFWSTCFSMIAFSTKEDGPATGLFNANAEMNVRKYIKAGRFEMEINGKIYNAAGQEVR